MEPASMSRAPTVAFSMLALLSACTSYPTGPAVMVLPGSGATFEQFQYDDAECQGYAQQSSGTSAESAAQKSAVDSAVVGTAVGAAAGALIGSASGDAGEGAAAGAGSGLLLGSAAGSGAYAASGDLLQRRYDTAYVQCMYAKGHQVPVPAGAAPANHAQQAPADTSANAGGFPPPGTPPPSGY
jgi:hypothetical protein